MYTNHFQDPPDTEILKEKCQNLNKLLESEIAFNWIPHLKLF